MVVVAVVAAVVVVTRVIIRDTPCHETASKLFAFKILFKSSVVEVLGL